MDGKNLTNSSSDASASDAVRCLICLTTFTEQLVANPQHCEHLFCFTCIQEWAKTTNTCPVDRLEFEVLYQRSCFGGDVTKIVKVEPCDGRALEDEDDDVLSVCERCGRSDRRHLMLLCSACDSRYHICCLSPPLAAVPAESWCCLDCAGENNLGLSGEDPEIDEAEVSDLISETVLTSSRLRSSTTQRLVPASTRRSPRLQYQNTTQTSPSPPVQHVPKYLLNSCLLNEDTETSDLLPNTQK